jgi:small subunit ribosomal protein S8
MSSDSIGDMLSRIMNATKVRHERVDVPRSKIKEQIAKILQNEGFIKSYKCIEDRKQGIIRIYLKFGPRNEMIINGIRRISKPGLRKYAEKEKIPQVLGGIGIVILSTSRGIMTDKEARALGIGGEILCYVW